MGRGQDRRKRLKCRERAEFRFSGEPASDMEMAIANLTYLGFNTERITFKNPDTSGVSWPNPIASNNTRLARI